MLILLSPSKTLDFKSPTEVVSTNEPVFIKDTLKLVKTMKKVDVKGLMEMMHISKALAELNCQRYRDWDYPFDEHSSKPALLAFKGDVYEGLKAWELNLDQIDLAQQHVRILSGLYGLLKPTDLILPYRLEMGVKLKLNRTENLYKFWTKKLTDHLQKELNSTENKVIVNLASDEYSKAIDFKNLKAKIVTPFFKEYHNGELKFVSFNGKKARGLMTRYIIDRNIPEVEELKLFDYEGYHFSEQHSDKNRWVFIR